MKLVFPHVFASALLALVAASAGAQSTPMNDPYLWLEDVQGERSLNWARERNAVTQGLLEKQPVFKDNQQRLLAVLDNRDQIPYVSRRGDYFVNFWRDAVNPRGLWRRTTLA